MGCEIDPDAPLTPVERLSIIVLILFFGALLFACFSNIWGYGRKPSTRTCIQSMAVDTDTVLGHFKVHRER